VIWRPKLSVSLLKGRGEDGILKEYAVTSGSFPNGRRDRFQSHPVGRGPYRERHDVGPLARSSFEMSMRLVSAALLVFQI